MRFYKYRIRIEVWIDSYTYYPQKWRWWWPFWCYFYEPGIADTDVVVSFEGVEQAKRFIVQKSGKRRVRILYV